MGDMICHFFKTFAENINEKKKTIIRCNFNKKFVPLWCPNLKKNFTEQKNKWTNEQKTEKSNMKIRTVLKMEKVPAGNKKVLNLQHNTEKWI